MFALVHPAFEQLWGTRRRHGEYRIDRYLTEYEIVGHAVDFHRPLSGYLNEMAALGCRLTQIVEFGLDPVAAAEHETAARGISAYVDIPNFLIVAAEAPG